MAGTIDVETPSTVHVIDDDDSFRHSMLRVLSNAGLHGVGYDSAGDFLIDRVKEQCEDESACILLDITMPGPSGIELMRALGARETSPPIIFVTGRDDILTSVDMMKGGAVDYLLKPVSVERLLAAIQRALKMDDERRVARRELRELHRRFESLTAAERCIFRGVVCHLLNKQLAVQLDVCERTVKTLRSHMMEKLQMTTVPELVRAAKLLEESVAGPVRAEPAPRPTCYRAAGTRLECRA